MSCQRYDKRRLLLALFHATVLRCCRDADTTLDVVSFAAAADAAGAFIAATAAFALYFCAAMPFRVYDAGRRHYYAFHIRFAIYAATLFIACRFTPAYAATLLR